jgi:NAD+-dependent secondary alcohol dehydrogenase Adh1
MRATMRAMVMRSAGTPLADHPLRLEEREVPRPTGPFDVVVRIAAAGVCRTDLHLLTGQMDAPCPLVLGHENAGIVHEVGELVSTVAPGDAVLCYPFVTDGLSGAERSGLDTAAPDRRTPGINADGGYAEYLLTAERSTIVVPAGTDLAAMATLTDAGLAAYRSAKRAAATLTAGDTVVVVGAGGLGHLGIQILRALGPARVVAVDTAERARGLALECGAHEALTPGDAAAAYGGSVRAVIDYVGADETAALALDLLAFGGHVHRRGGGGRRAGADRPDRRGREAIEGVRRHLHRSAGGDRAGRSGLVRPRVTSATRSKTRTRSLHDLAAGRILGRAVLDTR